MLTIQHLCLYFYFFQLQIKYENINALKTLIIFKKYIFTDKLRVIVCLVPEK